MRPTQPGRSWRQHGAPPPLPGENQANKQTNKQTPGRVFRFTPHLKPEEDRSPMSTRNKRRKKGRVCHTNLISSASNGSLATLRASKPKRQNYYYFSDYFCFLAGAERSIHSKLRREEKAYGDHYTGGVAPQRNRDW
jgi:hypothetical protein